MNRYVVVTGLPASGKSTVAAAVSRGLRLPLLDKDDFLESLFDGRGPADPHQRRELSSLADRRFQAEAERSGGAVLASWWRHPASLLDSGTPTEWLRFLPGALVELHCGCAPAVAAIRFLARGRHPGHLDDRWSYTELLAAFSQHAALGPLRVGTVVEVHTEQAGDLTATLATIAAAFESLRAQTRDP